MPYNVLTQNMWPHRPHGVVFSAHLGTNRENIGDVLSAKAIALLGHIEDSRLFVLPVDIGSSANINITYGGGGMVRPGFARREVFRDYLARNPERQYKIFGVGLNQDIGTPPFSEQDITALDDWVSHATSVAVRDLTTKNFLIKITSAKIAVEPCPTYSILARKRLSQNIIRYAIGVVVSFGHTVTYRRFLPQIEVLITELQEKIGEDNVLLICHDEADREYAKNRFPMLRSATPKTFDEVVQAYSSVGQVISLRGHGVIFAAALGVICSPILLCDKIGTLYEYHYGVTPLPLTFKAYQHLDYLRQGIVPSNLLPALVYAKIKR